MKNNMPRVIFLLILACFAAPLPAHSQSPEGRNVSPVVPNTGVVFYPGETDMKIPEGTTLKAVIEADRQLHDEHGVNRLIESGARFLNINGSLDIPKDQMEVAVVVHGKAVYDLLTDEAYAEAFGKSNPNTPLLLALQKAGVAVYICSQSYQSRGIPVSDLNPSVQKAPSAMTALVLLQQQGYQYIKF